MIFSIFELDMLLRQKLSECAKIVPTYKKLWLCDEIISGKMPLRKVPKEFFSQFFSLIQHIYCSIDNTYSSKICIHIKPRTSNLCTVCRKTSATEFLTNQKVSHHSKFQSCLWLLIGRKFHRTGFLAYWRTKVRKLKVLSYIVHICVIHI